MKREKVIATINDMPNDFDLDLLLEKLIFIEKVEKGLEQADAGDLKSHDDVKHLAKTWTQR